MNKMPIFALIAAVIAILATQSFFIVDQKEQAIMLFLGKPDGDSEQPESFIKGPGIHFKIPMLHTVRYFDRRILSVDPGAAQVVISSTSLGREIDGATNDSDSMDTSDLTDAPGIENVSGEPIILDTFARYKISDPLQFMKTLRTTEQAESRIENIINDATRAVLGKSSLRELLSSERSVIMQDIQRRVNRQIKENSLGIEIVDVRIIRADLTSDLRDSTVRRMISELKARATETRAKGEERALEIRSTADKEREVILAEAQKDAEIIRGLGDQEAIQTYASAFNKDRDFYNFYRSTEAYKNALANPETTLVINPDSEFFDYFNQVD